MPFDAAYALALARVVGENALIVFGVALAALLLVVGAAWFIIHRLYVRRHTSPDSADARALSATLAFGFATLVVTAWLFTTLPGWIVLDGWLGLADQALTDAIRHHVSFSALQLFATITVLANTPVLWTIAIVGALILLWRRDYFLAIIWLAAIGGNGILTRVLKATFARARPLYEHELSSVQGWSFPSGHSSGAVATYGVLAYVLIRSTPVKWHLPIVLVATATAFATGCSRIFLQVHYASDVLAGFASGLAWLSICIIGAEVRGQSGRNRKHASMPSVPSVRQ